MGFVVPNDSGRADVQCNCVHSHVARVHDERRLLAFVAILSKDIAGVGVWNIVSREYKPEFLHCHVITSANAPAEICKPTCGFWAAFFPRGYNHDPWEEEAFITTCSLFP